VGHGIQSVVFLPQRRPNLGLLPPQRPLNKALQRQVNSPSKGLKSNVSCQIKSHLIQEPPKHVHQNYLFKLNKCSKTLCNLPSLGMGGLSWWPIGWIIPQVKECFLGGSSPSHVKSMKWMGVKLLGMGFMTYKGSYYLIYGCLCRGCVAPSFSMQPFSKPIYCH
jgi:hypothetical protein